MIVGDSVRYIAELTWDVTSPSVVRCGECSEAGIVGQSRFGLRFMLCGPMNHEGQLDRR